MNIQIKKSRKPVEYHKAIKYLEKRFKQIIRNEKKELIWVLEHPSIFTAGVSYNKSEIIDKKIKIVKTNRGGKITWHGPGQKIFYFVINLNKRKKDIRKFLSIVENSLINTLKEYEIKSFADKKNIGIWVKHEGRNKKIASIGIKIKKWIAYHGFSLNVNNSLKNYKKILPCGLKSENITNLKQIKKINYINLEKKIIKNFISNMES